jgi:hypothetical protein
MSPPLDDSPPKINPRPPRGNLPLLVASSIALAAWVGYLIYLNVVVG